MVLVRGSSGLSLTLALLAIAGAASSIALAGNTWDGGGANNNWTTGQNWNPATGTFQLPPFNNGLADIVMAGTTRLTPIVDVPYSIRSLTFDNTAGAFVILGAEELTIGAGGITNNDTQLQSVIGPVKLAAHQTWTATAGQLQMDAVTLNGFNLALAGGHQITLPNIILGTGMITMADGYASTVTMLGTASNTYNGATHVNDGTLVLHKTAGAVAIPASLYIESVVRLNAAEQIAASGYVEVESGGLLNLNGHNETFARLIVSPGGGVTTGAGKLNITQEFQVTGGDVTGNVGLGDVTADVTLDGHVTSGADLLVGDAGMGSMSIRLSSSVSNANGYIGDDAGSMGEVSVDGIGSGWGNSGDLYVGNAGVGTLDVTGGATGGGLVSSVNGFLGNAAGSTGTANVGMNARWNNSGDLYVGNAGNGTLNIAAGGRVNNAAAYIGDDSGAVGEVTVDGTDSGWTISDGLFVGYSGKGNLMITNGGAVQSLFGDIGWGGQVGGGDGSVTVDGTNSVWLIGLPAPGYGQFIGGVAGHGVLNITGGGRVSCNRDVQIGREPTSTGEVNVDGAGSAWEILEDLEVGVQGSAMLRVTGGGRVTNVSGSIGASIQSSGSTTGAAIVDGANSLWMNFSALRIGFFGNGMLTVSNGGQVQASGVFIGHLGRVDGDGDIVGNVQNGGLVSPGVSPGALNIDGEYTQSSAGELLIELASATSYDQFLVAGDATLGGTLTLNLLDGFEPSVGQSFTILTADDVDGTFATEMLPTVPGLMFDVIYNPQSVVLTVLPAFTADFDEDGDVDGDDLTQWQGDFGENAASDADNDGDSDGADFLAWQQQLGAGEAASPSSASAPEPGSAGMLLLMITAAAIAHVRTKGPRDRLRVSVDALRLASGEG